MIMTHYPDTCHGGSSSADRGNAMATKRRAGGSAVKKPEGASATRKVVRARTPRRAASPKVPKPVPDVDLLVPSQPFLDEQLYGKTTKKAAHDGQSSGPEAIRAAASHIRVAAPMPVSKLPDEIVQ